jgi:hypothetical protein
MAGDVVPKISEALSAAAGAPVVAEAAKRSKAVVAAAKGELELPEEKSKKSRWFLWLAITAGLAGVAVFVVRKVLGAKDADWQAARPTTPYAPAQQTTAEGSGAAGAAAAAPTAEEMDDEAGEDPQAGRSAHLYNLEADGAAFPDQPAEGGDIEAFADQATGSGSIAESADDMTTRIDEAFAEAAANIGVESPTEATSVGDETSADTTLAPEAAESSLGEGPPEPSPGSDQDGALLSEPTTAPEGATRRYQGEGVYIGSEPPEGFTIKGNERSMKYHVPESAGYSRTVAEVWFNSEEAAQQAGFMRAQR